MLCSERGWCACRGPRVQVGNAILYDKINHCVMRRDEERPLAGGPNEGVSLINAATTDGRKGRRRVHDPESCILTKFCQMQLGLLSTMRGGAHTLKRNGLAVGRVEHVRPDTVRVRVREDVVPAPGVHDYA